MTPQDKINALAMETVNETDARTFRTMENIHKELVADVPNAVLPEDVFVRYFLDYFKNPMEDSHLLYKWIELAGGHYNEVDLIDNNGDVVITVPGLYASPDIDNVGMSTYNFADIAARYSLEKSITSFKGDSFINMALSGVNDKVKADAVSGVMRWYAIINKYSDDTPEEVSVVETKESVDVNIFDI